MTTFQDPDRIHTRARNVHNLIDALPLRASLFASETRVGYPGRDWPDSETSPDASLAVFDAVAGEVSYADLDEVRRTVKVPEGATAEAVASLIYALATVIDWSDGQG